MAADAELEFKPIGERDMSVETAIIEPSNEIPLTKMQGLQQVPAAGGLSPLVVAAMNGQLDTEKLAQLLAIQKDYERNEAEKAFHLALSDFKKNSLVLDKDKLVSFTTQKGKTEYRHTTLGAALSKINPMLGNYGLSIGWETQQESGRITVKCILSHALGFSKSTSLSAAPDDSGGKNSIQAIGSTVHYLERYTAFSLLGIASKDQDDDGHGAGDSPDKITAEQAADLEALLTEVGANRAAFLKFIKCESVEDILAKNYANAIAAIEQKRKQK